MYTQVLYNFENPGVFQKRPINFPIIFPKIDPPKNKTTRILHTQCFNSASFQLIYTKIKQMSLQKYRLKALKMIFKKVNVTIDLKFFLTTKKNIRSLRSLWYSGGSNPKRDIHPLLGSKGGLGIPTGDKLINPPGF